MFSVNASTAVSFLGSWMSTLLPDEFDISHSLCLALTLTVLILIKLSTRDGAHCYNIVSIVPPFTQTLPCSVPYSVDTKFPGTSTLLPLGVNTYTAEYFTSSSYWIKISLDFPYPSLDIEHTAATWCIQFHTWLLLYLTRFYWFYCIITNYKFQIHHPADHSSTLSPPGVNCSTLYSTLPR